MRKLKSLLRRWPSHRPELPRRPRYEFRTFDQRPCGVRELSPDELSPSEFALFDAWVRERSGSVCCNASKRLRAAQL